jgi:cytochrome d ubiquinol oxidase subunit II
LESPTWRTVWDYVFCSASLLASLVFGVAVGSAMTGIPLDARGVFRGSVVEQIGLYPICTGLLTVAMFAMHGAIYLCLKTEGELRQRLLAWAWRGYYAFLAMYLAVTVITLVQVPRAIENFEEFPWAWLVVALNILAIANIPRNLTRRRLPQAFLSSCCTIAALVFLFGVALFPNLVTSAPTAGNSLTIYNAASSEKTLKIMTIVAVIGMPFVLAYPGIVYWTFRGTVKLDKHSY